MIGELSGLLTWTTCLARNQDGRHASVLSCSTEGLVRSVASACSPHDSSLVDAAAARVAEREIRVADQMATVAARGVSAVLAYRIDQDEHIRRRDAGMVAVTRLDWLHALLGLPVGMPVSCDALSPWYQQIVKELPPGCVQVSRGAVVRLLLRPVRVELAVVMAEGNDWQAGLRQAGVFSGYCTRVLAIAEVPDDVPEARVAAARHGIGLVVGAVGSPVTVVPATRFTPAAHTAAGWRFTEQVYQEIAGDALS